MTHIIRMHSLKIHLPPAKKIFNPLRPNLRRHQSVISLPIIPIKGYTLKTIHNHPAWPSIQKTLIGNIKYHSKIHSNSILNQNRNF